MPSPNPDDEPLLRLEKYLVADNQRIEEARERLVDMGDALMALRARMHNIDLGDDPGVQVLTQKRAAPIAERLAGAVDRTAEVVLSTHAGAGHGEGRVRSERSRAVEGQQQRVLVHPVVLESELARSELASLRSTGQRQRVSDVVGIEFLVLGEEAVITLSRWGDPEAPYVVIRNPALVQCFLAWFDLMWSVSPLVSAPEAGAEEALIRMLALGAKDEMIARTLHIGLRTVRRRVAALMDQYGVSSRFQLGAVLERDGRLPDPAR